jgi:hypothetical protein
MHTAAVAAAPAIVGAAENTKGNGARIRSRCGNPRKNFKRGCRSRAMREDKSGASPRCRSHLGHWTCLVGAAGFEPTTPCPPDKCANRAAPRPDRNGADFRTVRVCCSDYRISPHVATLSLRRLLQRLRSSPYRRDRPRCSRTSGRTGRTSC